MKMHFQKRRLRMYCCMLLCVVFLILGAAFAEAQLPDGAIPFDTSSAATRADGTIAATIATRYLRSVREGQIGVSYAIENSARSAITGVTFEVDYLDAAGNVLNDAPFTVRMLFMEQPIAVGETRINGQAHNFAHAERAVGIDLRPVRVETAEDLPPWTEPVPNRRLFDFCNYAPFTEAYEKSLADTPVLMRYRNGQYETIEITDPELIRAVLAALPTVQIGEASPISICDGDIVFAFTQQDGTEWGVLFETEDLFVWHGQNYTVTDFGDLAKIRIEP